MNVTLSSIPRTSGPLKGKQDGFKLDDGKCLNLLNITNDINVTLACLKNPDNCQYGISVSIWLKLHVSDNAPPTRILMSTGEHRLGFTFKISLDSDVNVEIRGKKQKWTATLQNYNSYIKKDGYSMFAFKWSKIDDKIDIMVNSHVISSKSTAIEEVGYPDGDILKLGCIERGGVSTDFLRADVYQPALWLFYVCEEAVILTDTVIHLSKQDSGTNAPTPTTIPIVPTDYSQAVQSYPDESSDEMNQLFDVADHYYACNMKTLKEAHELKDAAVLYHGVAFQTAFSLAKLGSCPQGCPCDFTKCDDGVTVSLWINMPSASLEKDGAFFAINDTAFVGIQAKKLYITIKSKGKSYSFEPPTADQTTNIAFTYMKEQLTVFVNGVSKTYTEIAQILPTVELTQRNEQLYQSSIIIGNSRGPSIKGLKISDVVIWTRLLFDFEAHRFFGFTAEQFTMLKEGTKYWTSDRFVNAALPNLCHLIGNCAAGSLYEMKTRKSSASNSMLDRWNKSYAAFLDQKCSDILVLGNGVQSKPDRNSIKLTSKCITDPSKCTPAGFTVSLWFVIRAVGKTEQIFVNSGSSEDVNSESKGFSIYTDKDKLLVVRVTNKEVFVIRTDPNTYNEGHWFNVGLTWSAQGGIRLYLNAIDYNIKNPKGTRISTQSSFDFTPYCMVGAYAAPELFECRKTSSWEYPKMVFGDLAYFNQSLDIDEYRRRTGNENANLYYLNAAKRFQGTGLIDLPYTVLKYAKKIGGRIGNQGHVTWNSVVQAACLKKGKIILSHVKAECPSVLSRCNNGISVGGWFRMKERVTNQSFTFFKVGNESDQKDSLGMELIDGKDIYGWVHAGGKNWSAKISNVEFSVDQWKFYAITWSSPEGLRLLINGVKKAENKQSVAYSSQTDSNNDVREISIGELYSESSGKITVSAEVFNFVIFESLLELQQQNKLIGVKKSQLDLLQFADLYIPFSGLYGQIKTPKPVLKNVKRSPDRFEVANAAVCTQTYKNSYIDMGDVSKTCLVDTSDCTSFILTINLKLKSDGNEAIVLTSGPYQSKTKGLLILKTSGDYLNFTMRTSVTHKVAAKVETGKWIQLQVIWYKKKKGFQVKVDGEDRATVSQNEEIDETNDQNGGNLTVGRESGGGKGPQPASPVCVSDIMVRFFRSDDEVEAVANSLVDVSCYQEQDFMFKLQGNVTDRNGRKLASKIQWRKGPALGNSFKDKCLSDPSKCTSEGFTVSIWIKMESGTSGTLMTTGPPTDRGMSLTLAKGEDSKYNVNATVSTGKKLWTVKAIDAIPTGVWSNLALVWTPSEGIFIFVGGLAVARGNTPSIEEINADGNGNLFVGRDDKDSVSSFKADISNLVIWYKKKGFCNQPDRSKYILEGNCEPPKDESTPGRCNLYENCIKPYSDLCLDGTTANLLELSEKAIKIKRSDEVVKVMKDVINKVGATSPALLKAKMKLITNICKNLEVPSDPDTDPKLSEALTAVDLAIDENLDENMGPKWEVLRKDKAANPLLMKFVKEREHLGLELAKKAKKTCKPYSRKTKMTYMQYQRIDADTCGNKDETIAMENTKLTLTSHALKSNPTSWYCVQQYKTVHSFLSPNATEETAKDPSTNATISYIVNSRLVSATIEPLIKDSAKSLLRLSLKLNQPNQYEKSTQSHEDKKTPELLTRLCFYDSTLSQFSDIGCTITSQSITEINGSCRHMTSFAALMQPVPPDNNAIHRLILMILSYIGSIVSLISLLIFIIVILVRKELSGERYLIHLNLAIAFFLAQLGFLLTQAVKDNLNGCRAVGVMMHLFFVAGFAWLLAESLFAFYAVTAGVIEGRLKAYVPFAWGVPLIIVATTAGIDISAYGHGEMCWLTIKNYFIWAFLGPVLAFSCVTIIVCSIVACNLTTPAIKKAMVVDQLRAHSKQTACLMPLMLLAWLMGTILMMTPSLVVQYIFVIFNAPQGFWIFLCFGLMNPEVKAVLCRRKRNTVADSQQWENIQPQKSGMPTFHSASSHSPPPTYRSTRSLVSSSGSENTFDRPQTSTDPQRTIQSPAFYTDPAIPDGDFTGGTLKYHA